MGLKCRLLYYNPQHNGWPDGYSFFSLKGPTIRPTIVLYDSTLSHVIFVLRTTLLATIEKTGVVEHRTVNSVMGMRDTAP